MGTSRPEVIPKFLPKSCCIKYHHERFCWNTIVLQAAVRRYSVKTRCSENTSARVFFSSIICSYLAHVQGQAQKIKKIHPQKNSLCFRKWNFLTLILKKSYIFSKESFSYISGNGTLDFSSQARKIKKIHPEKISNIKTFLIFSQKKAVLIFQETETRKKFIFSQKKTFLKFQETKILKKIPCISGSSFTCSKSKKFLIFRENGTFQLQLKKLLIFQKELTKSKYQKLFILFLIEKQNFLN